MVSPLLGRFLVSFNLQSAICGLQSAVCGLQSPVCSLQMSYTGPQLGWLWNTTPRPVVASKVDLVGSLKCKQFVVKFALQCGCRVSFTALFTNMRTLKFKSRLHNCVFRCRQSYLQPQATNLETQKHTKRIEIHQSQLRNHDLLNLLK